MKFLDERIVNGTIENDRLIDDGDRVFYKIYNRQHIVFERAEDVYLYDKSGNEYLDFAAGIAVCGLGYSNILFRKMLKERIDTGLIHTSNLFYNEPSIEAAEKLTQLSDMDRVFFTNSGTEAIEGALKIARRYSYNKGRKNCEIIAMKGSFHGRSLGALSVTGNDHYREPFENLIPGVRFADFNDLSSVESLLNDNTGAIILETIQGEGGIYPAEREFLEGIRRICDEKDLIMILDEIQCGMGRTGYMFAWQEYNVKPDVLTVAKALGNGFPIGAFLTSGKANDAMKAGDHGSTYGGNPLAASAASIVLDIFKEADIPGLASINGTVLYEALEEIKNEFPQIIIDHRGKGLIQGLEFKDIKAADIVRKALFDEKLVLISAEHNTVRFVPPLVIEKRHILDMKERLRRVLK